MSVGIRKENHRFILNKKVRIGIYTLPLRTNYGGILQAWALQTVLKRMGHEVVTFNPCPYKYLSWKRMPFAYAKRIINRLRGRNTVVFYEQKYNADYDIKTIHLQAFIHNNMHCKEFREIGDLHPSEYDVLIAGSDQVWRPKYNKSYGRTIENAFFDFAENWQVKRIAYAASFGTDKWEFTDEQSKRCAKLAMQFSAVSVRESSGVKLCRRNLKVKAIHVLDPTMLLSRENYLALINMVYNTTAPSGNLLCYILDDTAETELLLQRVAFDRRLTPFRTNFIKEGTKGKEQIQPPVEQWLRNFDEASFVVTDSFHACVFSIIFRKPFIVIANERRGITRIESLLSMFCLSDHLVYSAAGYINGKEYNVSDDVMNKLDAMQQISFNFLRESLNRTK